MFACLISTAAFHIGTKIRELIKGGIISANVAATLTKNEEHKWSIYLLVIVIYLLPISISVLMYTLLYCHFKFFKNNQIGIENSDHPNERTSEGNFILKGLRDSLVWIIISFFKDYNNYLLWCIKILQKIFRGRIL